MSGTREGSLKSKEKLLAKNPNHYRDMGVKGGKVTGVAKGFAYMKEADPEAFKKASAKGGIVSKRGKARQSVAYGSFYIDEASELDLKTAKSLFKKIFKKDK